MIKFWWFGVAKHGFRTTLGACKLASIPVATQRKRVSVLDRQCHIMSICQLIICDKLGKKEHVSKSNLIRAVSYHPAGARAPPGACHLGCCRQGSEPFSESAPMGEVGALLL